MVKRLLFVFVMSFSYITYGQNDVYETESSLFEKVNQLQDSVQNSNLYRKISSKNLSVCEEAIETYNKIKERQLGLFLKVIEEYPNSNNILKAFFEKGRLEFELGKFDLAKESFIKVIDFRSEKAGFYWRNSFVILAMIEIEKKEFNQALKYLNESERIFGTDGLSDYSDSFYANKLRVQHLHELCNKHLKKQK